MLSDLIIIQHLYTSCDLCPRLDEIRIALTLAIATKGGAAHLL